ncbi:hypothetical protein EMCRGX_G002951 [Ephydatia muelleri]
MSTVVSLQLQSGETFDCVPLGDLSRTLSEFLNETLLTLEDEAKLTLPDTDCLVNPDEFKVFDRTHKIPLSLDLKLSESDYITRPSGGEVPVLLLESPIFRSPDKVHRDDYVRHVMKRGNTSSGSVGFRMELPPPPPPTRSSSLTPHIMPNDAILYLAGRCDPSSPSQRPFQVYSPPPIFPGVSSHDPSAMSLVFNMAEGDNTSEANVSVATEDTGSLSSSVSGSTERSFSEGRLAANRSSTRSLPRPPLSTGGRVSPHQGTVPLAPPPSSSSSSSDNSRRRHSVEDTLRVSPLVLSVERGLVSPPVDPLTSPQQEQEGVVGAGRSLETPAPSSGAIQGGVEDILSPRGGLDVPEVSVLSPGGRECTRTAQGAGPIQTSEQDSDVILRDSRGSAQEISPTTTGVAGGACGGETRPQQGDAQPLGGWSSPVGVTTSSPSTTALPPLGGLARHPSLQEQSPHLVISAPSPREVRRGTGDQARSADPPPTDESNWCSQSLNMGGVAREGAENHRSFSERSPRGRRRGAMRISIFPSGEEGGTEEEKEASPLTPTSTTPTSATPKHSPRLGSKWAKKGAKLSSKRGSRYVAAEEDGIQANRRLTILVHSAQQHLAGKIYENIKTFLVQFDIPNGEAGVRISIRMMIRGDYTVGQIKINLWKQLREEGKVLVETDPLWDPEKHTFTYQLNQVTFELYDEQQIFQTSTVIQVQKEGEPIVLQVEPKKMESREEKTLNMEIGAMIGIGLYQLQFANNDELDITRRKMVAVRKEAVNRRDPVKYTMEQDLTLRAVPHHVMDQISQQDGNILIRVYYTLQTYQTFQVEASSTGDSVIRKVFPDKDKRVKRDRFGIPADAVPEDYVLKVAGLESYIYGYNELLEYEPILKCLSKKLDIELFLVKKLDLEQDKPRNIPDWNLIDPSTGLTGTHKDLSIFSKEHTQVFTMSLWDMQHKFRVRVVGVDNFKCEPGENEVVYVEMGIYHGGHLLGSICHTAELTPSAHMRWNQWLVFDVQLKNLPKAARLCVCMYSGTRSRDTKRKSFRGVRKLRDERKGDTIDRPLHWVNMQILDHRALLRQGLLRLNLWPVQGDASDNMFLGMDQRSVGSTAVPDGNNSVVLYVELDTYAHPVACPTEGWGKESNKLDPLQVPKEGSAFHTELQASIKADPLAPLTKAQAELIWKFREHCATIPEALPKFLQCVEWANLEQVQEAHRLLKIWRPITMEVALELLDYHFADDQVRSLAVKRLSMQSKEVLLSILLQLIQVLKFEPYHDSALARFLLRQALTSKKIGHFFFWYLRSEMDSPEFSQRFGILLEAYLRGCGEGILKELQRQHTAVCNIMNVACTLKKYIDRTGSQKGVADYAKEELQKYTLPESFSPPYDPSVRMGQLNVNKSRVMDSKKTPLWLEFSNVDPTAINQPPIKIIAKNGDDLRQDMLTLQMLSLMDKLWQEQGLNLHIIPYGCISTGNNMGIIEVVQEAETVAKIQKDHGGTFSVLKDDPLYKWLEKKNPTSSKMELAVQKFTLSCAGYCVATYILGIGDRHNDNIMVTTSGVLFHIDFGHFLGNIKTFLGMNRERAPFVLTPDFEYVMGKRNSDTFKVFEETAVKAYLIIRKNANLFINLFSMMKCTGIPELTSIKDLDYLKGVMVLDKSEEQAAEHFKQQIQECLKKAWSTQINWLSHNFAHSHS